MQNIQILYGLLGHTNSIYFVFFFFDSSSFYPKLSRFFISSSEMLFFCKKSLTFLRIFCNSMVF